MGVCKIEDQIFNVVIPHTIFSLKSEFSQRTFYFPPFDFDTNTPWCSEDNLSDSI